MILVHICCSVDSHYFLQKLREDFVDEKLIGFFYDPNIHPYSEYQLRLLDVQRSCDMLNIELIEGEYDINAWFDIVRGYEDAPEKGDRCHICFDFRFENSAKKAVELNIDKMTSTLLTSPKKSIKQLQEAGKKIADIYGVEFLVLDYRKNNGTQEQSKLAKQDILYQQSYCGCIYALNVQRQGQKKIVYELLSPITNQRLPASIEDKLDMYKKRLQLEKDNTEYKIIKENFLNYRLLQGILQIDKQPVKSYILYFSMLKQQNAKYKIQYSIDNIYYLNRNNIRLLDIKEFNKRINSDYKNIDELIKNPPKIEDEIKSRFDIDDIYSTNAILILDEVFEDKKYQLSINADIFPDIKEKLIIF
jgi:predicted adenine nucleotide alpha hydrolase (AANH) superfamily ATPase